MKTKILLTLIIASVLLGCKVMSNHTPKGHLVFQSITKNKNKFTINFSSDMDYKKLEASYMFCLAKEGHLITDEDFENPYAVAPNNYIMSFYLSPTRAHLDGTIKEKNGRFFYRIIGSYHRNNRNVNADEELRQKIPTVGLTCSFINPFPIASFKQRYISAPLIIPKDKLLEILN